MKTVSSLSFAGGASTSSNDIRVSAVDPKTVSDVLSLDWKKGSPSTLSSLSGDGAVLDDAWAKKNDIDVGDRLTVRTALRAPADADRRRAPSRTTRTCSATWS